VRAGDRRTFCASEGNGMKLTAILLSITLLLGAVTAAQEATPRFRDPTAPLDARVQDLISRLTLQEKIDQLSSTAPAIPRLDVPAYDWWNEALHGVARAGRATVFPQAIGMAATWDPALLQRVASAIADEARAKHNASVKAGIRERYTRRSRTPRRHWQTRPSRPPDRRR
jgi:beta-glucosidase